MKKAKQKTIFLATANPNKKKEVQAWLGRKVRVKTLADDPRTSRMPDIPETSDTFYGNAMLKARTVRRMLKGAPVMAEDSGLCVRALDGAPGVYSARYAGSKASGKKLIAKLLKNMKNKKDRHAYFITVMVFIDRKGRIRRSTGRVYGTITEKPAGTGGFGYDPVFYYGPLGRTFAQLAGPEKNKVSHRSRALRKMANKVKGLSGLRVKGA